MGLQKSQTAGGPVSVAHNTEKKRPPGKVSPNTVKTASGQQGESREAQQHTPCCAAFYRLPQPCTREEVLNCDLKSPPKISYASQEIRLPL